MKLLVVSIAAALGAVIGVSTVGFVLVPLGATASSTSVEQEVVPGQTGTNDSGQTYGPLESLDLTTAPDLFEAFATNGRIGYVETAAFAVYLEPPASPQAAAERQPLRGSLPVYAVDGTTIIGQYPMGAGTGAGTN